jgi:hypothetical protein
VPVHRGPADQSPRVVRRVGPGQTGAVHAGDWVIERPRDVHFGANEGARPVVILLATLFKNGSPAAIPVPPRSFRAQAPAAAGAPRRASAAPRRP